MNPLAVLALTTFGPTLLLGAVQGGEALPSWSRWMMGIGGLAAMGFAAQELMRPPGQTPLVRGLQHELGHTADPVAALKLAIANLQTDPRHYDKLAA